MLKAWAHSLFPAISDPLDVRGFNVVMDGTTNSTTQVIAAVAAAAASGQTLYWPPGTALTTATIPLLHAVKHTGPGIIKRGSSLFRVEPRGSVTNHLYVAPAGVSTADGLSTSEPTTPQAAVTALKNYGPVLEGTWQIDFAAGAHAGFIMDNLQSVNPVRFIGVATGDFRTVPTSTVTKAASGVLANGIVFQNKTKAFLKDILVSDFTAVESAGVRAQQWALITLENVHATNCYYGWYFIDFTQYDAKGGTISSCLKWGVNELFFVLRNFKYAGGTDNRTIITDCETGVHGKELCTGHMDFVEISDCNYGIMLCRGSTMNPSDSIFKRNDIGIILTGRSSMHHAPDIQWNAGTADANTIQVLPLDPQLIESIGGSAEDAPTAPWVGQTLKTFGYNAVPFPLTGTTSNTVMLNSLGTLHAGEFQAENTRVHLKAVGTASLVSGTGILFFRLGGSLLASVTLPIGAAFWQFEVDYLVTATGDTQRYFSKCTYTTSTSSPAEVLINGSTRTFAHSTTAFTLNLTGQLANAGDSMTANFAEAWTTNR